MALEVTGQAEDYRLKLSLGKRANNTKILNKNRVAVISYPIDYNYENNVLSTLNNEPNNSKISPVMLIPLLNLYLLF